MALNETVTTGFESEQAIKPQSTSSSVNGNDIDLLGFDSCKFVLSAGDDGTTLDGSNHFGYKIQEADDDGTGSPSSWSDAADADVVLADGTTGNSDAGTLDATGDYPGDYAVSYTGNKRHARIVLTTTGSPSAVVFSATAEKGHPATTANVSNQSTGS